MSIVAGSLISVKDLFVTDIARILALTDRLEAMDAMEKARLLVGRRVALLFYESSTRTRTSFELAAKSLGAVTTLVSDKSSSIEKGESLKDTGLTLKALGAECIILRHPASGAPFVLERTTGLPVLNAGDGMHQHPSQALLDLRTILRRLGRDKLPVDAETLAGVTLTITGDIRHSRVARSNAMLLPRLGAKVLMCGPPELLPEEAATLGVGVELIRDFDAALSRSQVVMMLRIQRERLAGLELDLTEYIAMYQLNEERLARCAAQAVVMHPGPMIRGLEIQGEVADSPQSAIEEQVSHGLAVRAALLVRALEGAPVDSLLIRGGRVVDPQSGVDGLRDVLLRDGRVAAVEMPGLLAAVEVAETLDATECVVAPGLIDVHVHLREPGQTYKETIATGTRAAAAGGFTSVVAMPNTLPVNDSVETMEWMLDAARGPAVRLFAMPAATVGSQGERLTDFEALARAGALGFTDDGKPILGDAVMRAALVRAARLKLPVSQHAEDPQLSHGAIMNAGPVAFRLGLRGYPAEAEAGIVRRDIALLREIERTEGLRAHLHVQHVSTELALDAIREAKSQGLHVTCEAAPHHFTLTDEAVGEFDTNAKMNPPLRAESDRLAVVAALMDGTVDCIATDHAPHAKHEKDVEFERAPNGITGLETALGLALRVLHQENGMALGRVLELLSAAPARVVGLQNAGSLRVGAWADAVVFDAVRVWTYAASASLSKSKNSPFDGHPMVGKVKATVVGGITVFQE